MIFCKIVQYEIFIFTNLSGLKYILSSVIIYTFEPSPPTIPRWRGSIRKVQIMHIRNIYYIFVAVFDNL